MAGIFDEKCREKEKYREQQIGECPFSIDLFHIVCAHAYIGHVARDFSIIGETLQRWGKRILSH